MQSITLESPTALPSEFISRLKEHRDLFQENRFLEAVLENRAVRTIADDLNVYLSKLRIHGYHCTKEPAQGFFESNGLRPTDVRTHQLEFLELFGEQFTANEIAEMKVAWEAYFEVDGQRRLRDGLVWVCLSRSLVKSSGTETLFRYFGGESIFKPLLQKNSIATKLEEIGQPVIVEVSLPGDSVNARYEMAITVLSHHHAKIRDDAYPYQSEACLRQAVPPEDIVKVTPLRDFPF